MCACYASAGLAAGGTQNAVRGCDRALSFFFFSPFSPLSLFSCRPASGRGVSEPHRARESRNRRHTARRRAAWAAPEAAHGVGARERDVRARWGRVRCEPSSPARTHRGAAASAPKPQGSLDSSCCAARAHTSVWRRLRSRAGREGPCIGGGARRGAPFCSSRSSHFWRSQTQRRPWPCPSPSSPSSPARTNSRSSLINKPWPKRKSAQPLKLRSIRAAA